MTGLAIQPHSRRRTNAAVLVLSLIAAGSFGAGLARQLAPTGPSPFPEILGKTAARSVPIPDATPAPTLQVAESEPRPVRRAVPVDAEPAAADLSAALPDAASAPAAATDAAASDTAGVAPDAAPEPPAPEPDAPPT